MEQYGYKAVVLAAGDFPTHPLPASLLDHPRVVCCDSAAAAFIRSGRTPFAVVGDGDSIDDDTKSLVPFVRIPDQDTNDLTKAITWLRRQSPLAVGEGLGAGPLAIIGATGRREDHTLGNISLLVEYMRQGLDVTMITDHGIFRPARGTQTFKAAAGQQLSIFNFSCSRMRNDGLAYQFPPLTNWWMGTLNEALSENFTIEADGDYLVFWAF